jgi:2'-hydroxyisoflavone reductase
MDILILGGTAFLGRALVDVARARGHQVTLFNRGQTNPDLYPDVEKLRGDRRAGDLDSLKGGKWDAVIDTSGYEPGVVRASASALAKSVTHYTFISSISVFADFKTIGMDENAPLAKLPEGVDPDARFAMGTYGALKALCEQAAEEALPGRTLIIRPGLIVGPYDKTDRFTYWPVRIAQGGEVLVPARPEYPVQLIDVRDLAEWTLRMVTARQTGIYNATGPHQPLPIGSLFDSCQQVSGADSRLTWADEQFLLDQGVKPWIELPLWMPENDGEMAGMQRVSIRKALNAGLTFRPLADTVRDTLAWASTRPDDHKWSAGITREREAELLKLYAER